MKSSRLLNLLLILQTRERLTTTELAERLEVSRRTVLRDVEALSAAGVPVYAERGRTGGIVLLPGARLNVSDLEPPELEALSISGLDHGQLDRLGLTEMRDQITNKIAARQASGPKSPIDRPRLADLVVVDNAAWLAAPSTAVDIAELALDLRERRRLLIRYRRSAEKESSERVVDPYGLVSKGGRWYLIADTDGQGRMFALDRLEAYEALTDRAELRAGQTVRSVWTALRDRIEAPGGVVITARMRTSRLDLARRILGSRIEQVTADKGDWSIVSVRYQDVESVRQLLQFADHVEVLAPAVARERMLLLASDLAARHQEIPGQ